MQLDTLTLPDDFLWVNEFDWSPVAQSVDRSLTGALMVFESEKAFGRSIVLGDGDNSWLTKIEVDAVFALSQILNKKMDLSLPDGRRFTVIFDRTDSAPLTVTPIFPTSQPDSTDYYGVILRLLTVAAS